MGASTDRHDHRDAEPAGSGRGAASTGAVNSSAVSAEWAGDSRAHHSRDRRQRHCRDADGRANVPGQGVDGQAGQEGRSRIR